MRLCIVISSIGKTDRLSSLLESLANQSEKNFEVGICDQSSDSSVSLIARGFADRLSLFVVKSDRGLSRGRNAVVMAAPRSATHFLFPNDTSTLPPTFVADVYTNYATVDVLALSYVHDGSPRYSFAPGSDSLTLRNVWKIIEPGMVLSRVAFDLAGGFDESLGTGSGTPWQSGEGTDLLLRLCGNPLAVRWAPELRVCGVDQGFGLTDGQRRAKLRSYGRGYGFVLARWSYPLRNRASALVGPLVRAMVTGKGTAVMDSFHSAIGRWEGLLDGAANRGRNSWRL